VGNVILENRGLKDLLWNVVSKGFLKATNNGLEAIKSSNTIVIAVPTPAKNGITDLSFLESVLDIIRRGLRRDQLIVVESTIPPGTMEGFVRPLLEESGFRAEEDFFLAHVPERIAPGEGIWEPNTNTFFSDIIEITIYWHLLLFTYYSYFYKLTI